MKKATFAYLFILCFSFPSFSGPKCMSGAELPFQQVFSEKTGLEKALEASKIANPLSVDQIKLVCRAICSDNKTTFYDQVEKLMTNTPGTREEKIKKFFREYFSETRCEPDTVVIGVKACDNDGENFLRTSFEDFVDLTAEHMILNYNIDLNQKDSIDNLSTIEWLHSKCTEPDLLVRDYFCKREKTYSCIAFRQLPKNQQKNPPEGCSN